MLALTRETLVSHLHDVPGIVDLHSQHNPEFVARVVRWLEGVERSLLQLRNPLASLAAVQRTSVLAVSDGSRDPQISARVTARKATRAMASLAIGRMDTALRQTVQEIDRKLDKAREELGQLLAVATAEKPIPLPPTEPRSLWLEQVWRQMNVSGSTHGMHTYLSASLALSDRLFVLDEILSNLLATMLDQQLAAAQETSATSG